jgi:hypothetical protein
LITGIIAISEYTMAIEYDVSNNPIYVGEALPDTGKASRGWRIKFITYDVSNNATDVRWASGATEFDKIWNDRATYPYS